MDPLHVVRAGLPNQIVFYHKTSIEKYLLNPPVSAKSPFNVKFVGLTFYFVMMTIQWLEFWARVESWVPLLGSRANY